MEIYANNAFKVTNLTKIILNVNVQQKTVYNVTLKMAKYVRNVQKTTKKAKTETNVNVMWKIVLNVIKMMV